MTTIFREPTQTERSDFTPLSIGISISEDEEFLKAREREESETNKRKLKKSLDPMKETVSCFTCFKYAWKNSLVDKDHKFDDCNFTKVNKSDETFLRSKLGLLPLWIVHYTFQCPRASKGRHQSSYSFQLRELSPEAQQKVQELE